MAPRHLKSINSSLVSISLLLQTSPIHFFTHYWVLLRRKRVWVQFMSLSSCVLCAFIKRKSWWQGGLNPRPPRFTQVCKPIGPCLEDCLKQILFLFLEYHLALTWSHFTLNPSYMSFFVCLSYLSFLSVFLICLSYLSCFPFFSLSNCPFIFCFLFYEQFVTLHYFLQPY